MKRFVAQLAALLVALGCTACGPMPVEQAHESVQVFAMDTVMIVTAYGADCTKTVLDAEEEIYRLEELLSRTREESEVSKLNAAPADTPVTLDAEALALIELAQQWSLRTDGAFDCTLAPVSSAWGFTEDTFRVPSQEEITELLSHVGPECIRVEGEQASHAAGTKIDLGGIAKGYLSDVMAELFTKHDVPFGMVSLGGNVYVRGSKPDGTAWRVGIQDPTKAEDPDALVGILDLQDAYAITSGGYQRYFEDGGTTYHHILNPSTGYPAQSGLTSVTVIAGEGEHHGAMCDALSTALFVMGEEKALDFWRTSGYSFDLVLVTEDGRVVVTEGLSDTFAPQKESGYAYETVS